MPDIVTRYAPGALYPPSVVAPPRPLPIWRFFPAFVRNPLRSLPRQVFEDDLVTFVPSPGTLVVWVSSPDLVEQVLLTDAERMNKSPVEKRIFQGSLTGSVLVSDGAGWRWQRRALAPLFRPVDIDAYLPAMLAAADAQVLRWRQNAAAEIQHVDEDMLRTTYDVILATMLVGGRPAEAEEILAASQAYLSRVSWEMAYALMRLPAWLPHPATWQMKRAAVRLRSAVSTIIARRRAEGGSPSDLLGRLLSARDPDTGEPMPNELVVSNLLTLLDAGHETTAKALTWTLYLLARAPDWQQRVFDEIHAIAGGGPIEPEHVARFAVTKRVIKEAMRLYPPAPVMARQPTAAIALAGQMVPAGAQVLVPIYAIHRHRKLWIDPDRFDPDRFLPEAEAGRPRMQYLPFGGGARTCIGATFAMTEAVALLATFVQAARFVWDGRHSPEPVSRVTLRPAGGMPLIVKLR